MALLSPKKKRPAAKRRIYKSVLRIAETIDALRLFPRAFLLMYLVWIIRLTNRMVTAFIAMPQPERTVIVTSFIGAITTGVFGLFVWIYKIYAEGGRDWKDNPADDADPPTSSVAGS